MDGDALVSDYLSRLLRSADSLPGSRAAELQAEVAEHIETALQTEGRRDELTVRNVLERLGPPADIVVAEIESIRGPETGVPQTRLADRRSAWGPIEIVAVLSLVAGGLVVPIVGPLVGLALVWLSSQWTRKEKVIATAIVAVVIIFVFAMLAVDSSNHPIITQVNL
jgi:hypothetical protein